METYPCSEYINISNLNKMLHSKLLDDDAMNKLIRLKQSLKKESSHKVEFVVKEKLHRTKCVGRMYPKYKKQTLQDMPKQVRKALCYDQYTDLDIVNCHPVVLKQVFDEEKIGCASLDRYVLHRDLCLQETGLSRDEAKEKFISIMYGKSPKPNDSEFVKRFYAEFKEASDRLLSLAKYNTYLNIGIVKKDFNPVGCAMSFIGQDKEREIVSQIINYFKREGYETSTIIHDGFHIRSLNVLDEHIKEAEELVKKVCGYSINITTKPMNDFDANQLWVEDAPEDDDEVGDHSSAKLFVEWAETKGHHFRKCGKTIYWYNPDFGIWNDDLDDIRHLIAECEVISRDYRQMTKKKACLIAEMEVKRDDDFLLNARDATFMKLAFKNGVFCFDKQKLLPFSPDYTFFFKCPIDYKPNRNVKVYEKLFVDVFGEEKAKYVLKCLARALAGQTYDKTIFNVVGEQNSGKGVLTDMLMNAFGKFIGIINSGAFFSKQNAQDEAKARSWMVPIKDCRIVVANEIKMDAQYDPAMIKSFSGGDAITARQNFKDEMTFMIQATAFMFMNDVPTCKGGMDTATGNRFRFISTEYSYLEKDEYERHKHNTYVRKADTTLKSVFIKQMENIQAFAHLVLTSYSREKPVCPACVADENKEWVGEEDITDKVKKLIEETGDEKDTIPLSMLVSIAKRNGIDISAVRVGKILRGMKIRVANASKEEEAKNKDEKKKVSQAKSGFGIKLRETNFNDGDY